MTFKPKGRNPLKSSRLCESSNKFENNWKILASTNQAILTYLSLKNSFVTFYKRDSATFKLLNCLIVKNILNDLEETFDW